MATLNERSEEQRIKKHKTRRSVMLIIIAVLGVIALCLIIYFIREAVRVKHYTGYNTVSTFERADSNTVKYMYYEGNILKYSRDGASAYSGDGNVLWNGSYEMKDPIVDTCGQYVAIADLGEKEIYVYSGSDSGTLITVEMPVTMIRVAGQGVVAVMLENEKSNIIRLYDPYSSNEDKLLVEIPTNVKTDGYPVDMALSPDGQSLVTSYLSMNSREAESNVCFYNFSEVGQDRNHIVGGANYKESMVAKLEFVDDNTICIFQDNGFSLYRNMKEPKEVVSEYFDLGIKSVIYDEGYVGFIFESATDGEAGNHIKLYSSSGKVVYEGNVSYEYDKVEMCDGDIIFSTENACSIIRTDGSEKFTYSFSIPCEYFIKGKSKTNYYVVEADKISKVRLTED